MKKTMKALSLILVTALMLCVLAACGGSKHAEGTATVDVATTAGSGCLNPQVSSMLGATTELKLVIDGDSYTFTKHMTSPTGETGEGVDVTYTFTGSVSSSNGSTYTLAPATGVSYDIKWGAVADLAAMGLMPTEEGSGTEADDPSALNWFRTPYLKDNGGNANSMDVTIENGALTFPGFNLVEED